MRFRFDVSTVRWIFDAPDSQITHYPSTLFRSEIQFNLRYCCPAASERHVRTHPDSSYRVACFECAVASDGAMDPTLRYRHCPE
jgi:hypothetical protein